MTGKYETLDDYLNALDTIKQKLAEETQGMTANQFRTYLGQAE